MRFSLGTLLLVVLWLAMGMTVWVCREPWQQYSEVIRGESAKNPTPANSPDGHRQFTRMMSWSVYGWGNLLLIEIPPGNKPSDSRFYYEGGTKLLEFKYFSTWNHHFVDNDTFTFCTWNRAETSDMEVRGSERFITLKRRFPEWWWGHFYRVEVWLCTLIGGVLLRRGYLSARAWRTARRVRVLEASESSRVGISV